MSLSLYSIVFLLGGAQGVFLAFSLLSNRRYSPQANTYLAALTLVFVSTLLDSFLDSAVLPTQPDMVWLRSLAWPKEFFYGVLIYLYTCTLCDRAPFGKAAYHFIPAGIHCLLAWPMIALPSETQFGVMQNELPEGSPYVWWAWLFGDFEQGLALLHIGTYLVISIKILSQHERRIAQEFSYKEKIDLHWLRNLIYSILGLYIIWGAYALLPVDDVYANALDLALSLGIVALIYAMGYMGLRQPRIFMAQRSEVGQADSSDLSSARSSTLSSEPGLAPEATKQAPIKREENEPKPENTQETEQKYKKSSLSSELSKGLAEELKGLMQAQRPYLDAQLSLPQLAETLGVSTNYLSQVINEQFKQNFFDFVNSHRVQHAAEQLTATKDNVTDIALNAGFNSKSAFYTAFKKHLGQTPGQYRKQAIQ